MPQSHVAPGHREWKGRVAASLARSALNSGWAPGRGFAADGESLSTCRRASLPCPRARISAAGEGGGGVLKVNTLHLKNIYQAFEEPRNCSPQCQRTISTFIVVIEAPLLIVFTVCAVDSPAWVAATSLACHWPPSRSQPPPQPHPSPPSSGQFWGVILHSKWSRPSREGGGWVLRQHLYTR